MKRKKSNTTDLRSFLQRAAAKKHSQDKVEQEVEGGIPSTNQSCMQLVVFEGQTDGSGPSIVSPEPEAVRVEAEPTVIEDDEVISLNESDCSDEDNADMYQIEHDPGLRVPISSYDVNDQDSVRRAYIALGPC